MNEQPLDDDAELLRSLKPTRLEIDWTKVLSHLLESSDRQQGAVDRQPALSIVDTGVAARPSLMEAEPHIKRFVSSWWSGALAGSLITFALLRLLGTQPGPAESKDTSVALPSPSNSTKSQLAIENSNSTTGNRVKPQTIPQPDRDGWDPIVDSSVWSARFKRHGLGEKLVSRSTSGATESRPIFNSPLNSSDGLPKTQAELCRELLEFN